RGILSNELWTVSATGGEPQLRFSLGQHEGFIAVAWSPDSSAIVDIRASLVVGPGMLETRALRDGKPQVLLVDRALAGSDGNALAWLPDNRILFGLYKDNISESDLWEISLDSNGDHPAGQPARLTNTTGSFVAGLSPTADGKRLAIVTARFPFSVFV